MSGLPQNTELVKIHCQSKDDNLGVRTLKLGDQFDFSFHLNFVGSTLFHCSFLWGLKHQNFDVFKRSPEPKGCKMLTKFSKLYMKIFFYQNDKIVEEATILSAVFLKAAICTFAFFKKKLK